MLKSFLLLGAVFGAESQDFHQILAFARQLNQTFASGGSGQKRRKPTLTMPPLPLRCAAACPGMQCAYDDLTAWTKKPTGGDQAAMISTLGDTFGAMCFHRDAIKCSMDSADCNGSRDFVPGSDLMPCICDECPNFPKVYEGWTPLMTSGEGVTPTAEERDELLTTLCPMTSVFTCMAEKSACSSALDKLDGSIGKTLEAVSSLKLQCVKANKATDYATPYSFKSPTGCSSSDNLVVGVFSELLP
mmetsp:Transcript_87365/g.138693  ORF Transcript_87365/g.138693 Transcript_87365/m.138693 type:complete len:245 (+) Transcript_87365:60-794(+)